MANDTHGFYLGNDKTVFSADGNTITHNGVKYTKGTNGSFMKLYGQCDASDVSTSDHGVFLTINKLTNGKSLAALVGKQIMIYIDQTDGSYSETFFLTESFLLSASSTRVNVVRGLECEVQYIDGKIKMGYNPWQDDPADLTQPFALYILSPSNE